MTNKLAGGRAIGAAQIEWTSHRRPVSVCNLRDDDAPGPERQAMAPQAIHLPYSEQPSTAVATPSGNVRPPSRAARAFDWYIKLTLISAGGLITTCAATAFGVPDVLTTPASALFLVGGFHPAIVAGDLALWATGNHHHWIGDADPTCREAFWLLLAPYLGALLLEAGRRLKRSDPILHVLSPLCLVTLTLTSAMFAAYAQTTVFALNR